jgi:intein/homing endonuclease
MKSSFENMKNPILSIMYRKIVFLPRPKRSFSIPPKYKRLADEGKLTVELLLQMEYTEMLRLATYPPAGEFIFKNIGMRGLPLKQQYNLYPHQIKSLQWMRTRETTPHQGVRGGILSLKQGLGKSLTALTHLLISKKGDFPTLIISSLSVMHEWKSEGVEKFFGKDIKVLFYHKTLLDKGIYERINRKTIQTYDVVFTTYDVCVQATKEKKYYEETYEIGEEGTLWVGKVLAIHCRTLNQVDKPDAIGHDILYCTPWERVVCDESQKFANPNTKVFKCMMALYGKYKWCLTGTPIRNYCFPGDTRIITNKGNKTIRDLVMLKQTPGLRILSYNRRKDVFEYKKMEKGWKLKTENGLVKVTMGKKKFSCTPNHKILTMEGYVEAQNLELGSLIIHYGEEGTRTCAMNILSKEQEQVVIGSYLGDGHLKIYDYHRVSLSVTHSEKQKEYSEWKANIFQTKIKTGKQSATGYKHTNVYYFVTNSFYFPIDGVEENKKTVPQELIDKIDDIALLIWYLDDGFINKAGNSIELATCSFDDDTNERLCTKLHSMDIDCRVSKKWSKKQDKYYPIITLSMKGTRALISRIYKYEIPLCMRYKIDCRPLLRQLEDENRDLDDIFWSKHNISEEKRYEGMIVKEYTMGGKNVGTFKWSKCHKCDVVSFLCKRTDYKTDKYRCMMCRRDIHMEHIPFNVTNETEKISNKFDKSYQVHPVTKIDIIEDPENKNVYDIQVEDNHNFIIGSINQNIKYGPVVHNCTDIWAQLRFCGYTGIKKAVEWKRGGLNTFRMHNLEICIFTMDYQDAKVELPPKEERNELVTLTGNHKIFYDWMLGETVIAYDEMMKGACSFASVLAMFTRLRQCAIAPYLTTSQSKRIKNATERKHQEEMDRKIKNRFQNSEMFQWLCNKETDAGIESSKIKEIVNILRNIPDGEKVLVFSMFTSCLDLLVDAVKKHIPDFTYEQYDGDVKGLDRPAIIERFRKDKSLRCLFLNYKVGSEGLNLTEATHCICIEPWWTNAVHNQAKSRCWRSGQTKPVTIYNVLSNQTIEEKVMEICQSKDALASSYLEGTEKPLGKVGLNKFTLGKILGIF